MIFLVGVLIVLTMLIKAGLERNGLPPLVGYLMLGLLLRWLDDSVDIFSVESAKILAFFGKIGLIALLFRVGLESNLRGLLKQLRSASLIWVADIAISGTLGFLSAFYLLRFSWNTSLIVATAFTATSVGISVSVWQDMNALKSANGELLVDVAELDDISAVVLMALLFAVLPHLNGGEASGEGYLKLITGEMGIFLIKLFGYGLFCFLFSRYLEKPLTHYFLNLEAAPAPMLAVAGIGFIIAAMAAWLGFSLAIGAFFAGLVFSRDPRAVKMEGSFMPLYELFSPFFFIAIGLQMDPSTLDTALGLGAILAALAIAGKLLADGLPVFFLRGWQPAMLIGISMVPRAEIALVIMQRGHASGAWAVPPHVYGAMILVCAATCLLAPLTVRPLLRRWPQKTA
jgi:Kef-type K+ transport system membrane component KefB